MYKYNRESFFNHYRNNFGRLTPKQIKGLDFLLKKLEISVRIESNPKRAYVLATVAWETAWTYEPITEYGSDTYLRSKLYYPYIGRGYAGLTWEDNYRKFGKALNLDLVNNPVLANAPEIAWKILEMGMTDDAGIQDPDFTAYTLEDYFDNGRRDFYSARRIINPRDYKSYEPIKQMAQKFNHCLVSSIIAEDNIPEPRGYDER